MENGKINEQILEIWKKYPQGKRPILYPLFKKNGILFIGCNPSFSNRAFAKIRKGTKYEGIDIGKELTKREMLTEEDKEFLVWEQAEAIKKCEYFKRFKEISKETGLEFQHIDLFFFRETNQERAKERIFEKDKLSTFAKSQLKIVVRIIEEVNPKVIVVANALASGIINNSDLFSINKEKFAEDGFDRVKVRYEEIPIFFSSMFSGQRALDTHSFRRLKWQIKNWYQL